jgi:hypothetical protein
MATCNPFSSNDLRVANFRLPSVYFRRSAAPVFHRRRISSWIGRALLPVFTYSPFAFAWLWRHARG